MHRPYVHTVRLPKEETAPMSTITKRQDSLLITRRSTVLPAIHAEVRQIDGLHRDRSWLGRSSNKFLRSPQEERCSERERACEAEKKRRKRKKQGRRGLAQDNVLFALLIGLWIKETPGPHDVSPRPCSSPRSCLVSSRGSTTSCFPC